MATVTELYDVEGAIAELFRLNPALERGATATPGDRNYEKLGSLGKSLKRCTCGQRTKGWKYPEFIATVGGKVWSVGGDATTNKISAGDKGFHSARYGGGPGCDRQP